MRRPTDRTLILAIAGCAAAALFFAVTLARALTVDATPPADMPVAAARAAGDDGTAAQSHEAAEPFAERYDAVPLVREGGPAAVAAPDRPLTRDALMLAVENDPFQENRQRPPERYRMPGDAIESAAPPPPPPPPFQVLGIAQIADGGLAVMQIEDAPPRVVAVGESLFGYTLDRVEGEVATMTGQGRTLNLTVAQAAQHPPAEEVERDSRDRGSRDERESNERRREQVEMLRTLERQLRGREDGAVNAIRRMLEQRGGRMEVVPSQNGRVILRARVDSIVRTPSSPDATSR